MDSSAETGEAHAAEADEIEIGVVGYDAKEAHVLGS